MTPEVALWEFLSIGAVALFSFLSVVCWSDYRHRERVAYYRSEALRKIAEREEGAAVALEFLREGGREK